MPLSAGLMPFRRHTSLEILVAHPGGPFFARKDAGSWGIVKGLVEAGEEPIDAALREFAEETGWAAPGGAEMLDLGSVTLKSRKTVRAWAFESDFDPATLDPGEFQMAWRGRLQSFPEIDRVVWAEPPEARRILNPAQAPFLDRLISRLADADC